MSQRDLMDQIANSLVVILERGRETIQKAYFDITPNESYKIFKDRQPELTLASAGKLGPVIEIVRNNKESEWKYTRVKEEKYNFWLDCSIKSTHREVAQEYVNTFCAAVMSWMNQLENLKFKIEGTCAVTYDSHATDLEVEYRRGYGFHSGRINYYTKVINSGERVFA
jgi:hypothetical protein